VPGILVETAFINHKEDRVRLLHPRFRERAARAIAAGLIRFLDAGSKDGGPEA
jgi:N-acetylmuramoyl-L-alanine amidase